MLCKSFLFLSASLIILDSPRLQLNLSGNQSSVVLPEKLSESETKMIQKENRPTQHVIATLKVSEARLSSSLKLAQANSYNTAEQDAKIYVDLIVYADDYTRKLNQTQLKERYNCLKKIEQAVFKQSRTIDQVDRKSVV